MFEYHYSQITSGYRWNCLQRILNTIGLEPTGLGDVQIDGVWYTVLTFSRALITAEKSQVDAIMADNPSYPPKTAHTVYRLKEIWETRGEFSTKLGTMPFHIYYDESVRGSGVFDRIELHFQKTLGASEENKLRDEYNLMFWNKAKSTSS